MNWLFPVIAWAIGGFFLTLYLGRYLARYYYRYGKLRSRFRRWMRRKQPPLAVPTVDGEMLDEKQLRERLMQCIRPVDFERFQSEVKHRAMIGIFTLFCLITAYLVIAGFATVAKIEIMKAITGITLGAGVTLWFSHSKLDFSVGLVTEVSPYLGISNSFLPLHISKLLRIRRTSRY